MGRRRSASSTTRIVQGLLALVWIGFMVYMISNYLKGQKGDEVAGGEEGQPTELVQAGADSVASTGLGLTPPGGTGTPTGQLTQTTPLQPAANRTSGPTARNILDNVIAAYQNAPAYSDRAILKQEFILQGRAIKEEYPWSTQWSNDGRLQTNIFDVQVRSNGSMLSCFVSEIRKENLQNQQLFLKGSQLIQQLYRDKIASYYLNGGERIPVNASVVPNGTLLTPPPITLLTGEVSSPWIGRNVQPQKLPDETVEGNECFVIQCPGGEKGDLIAWVDKRNYLVRKVKLPNILLPQSLVKDPEVRDLNFFAEFTGASFTAGNVAFDRVAPRKDSWPVGEFVAPADPLPTNLLGELAPEFTLNSKRETVTDRQIAGKPMVILFLDGSESDTELIQRLETIRKSSSNSGFGFTVVAGPGSIETSDIGSWRLASAIQPAANRSKLPFLADLRGETARAMEFASLPAVAVMDSKLNIQYADLLVKPAGYNGKLAVSDKWDSRLVSAISATAKGINVADDMRSKYRSYLDKYFNDRDARLVANYFPGYSVPGKQKIAAVPANVRREQSAQRSDLKLNPRLVWESRQLKKPGNVAILPDSNRRPKGLLILDGWQTVSMFSIDGKPVSRKRLELPERVAVTTIRPVVSASGEQRFAMFSVGGQQLHIFDGSMEMVESFPKSGAFRSEILACEVLPGSATKNDQLLVCFGGSNGAMMFDTFTGQSKSIGETAVRALALSGRSVIAADDRTGALLSMDNGRTIDDQREYSHIKSGAAGGSVFAATSMNASGEWSLVLIDRGLKIKHTFAISSAIFQNGLEPVSGVATADGKGTWAVADSGNRIYLLSDEGVWLGDMATDGNVSGMQLMTTDGRIRLIVSTDKKIECWELNFAPERVGVNQKQRN